MARFRGIGPRGLASLSGWPTDTEDARPGRPRRRSPERRTSARSHGRRTTGRRGGTSMSQLATERRPATGQQTQWASIEQVPERMRRMLEQTLGSFATPALLSEAAAWTPPVDIEEEDDAYVIEAEVPGAKREDVNIELQGNELAITGEIKERERKGILRRNTR